MISIDSEKGAKLVAAGGALESGMIANMRTYMLPREPKGHVRILGDDRTLCGRSLVNNDQWAWQFINRGRYNECMPAHVDCEVCLATEIVTQTLKVQAAKRTGRLK